MNVRYLVLATALLAITGCDQMQATLDSATGDGQSSADTSEVIALVNGEPITQAVLDMYMEQRAQQRGAGSQESREEVVLNELISLELMRQQAISIGADKDPAVAATLNQLQRSTLAGVAIKAFVSGIEFTEEEVRAAYDNGIGKEGDEYNARHILVETEEEAVELIKQLDEGADFAKLAEEKSTGPSGPRGGSLGWFGAGQMVKPFSDATAEMEKGSYSKTPVQTQFGWHVIKLEDIRQATPPPYDDVKGRLKMMIQNQRIQKYVDDTRNAATIEIKHKKDAGIEATSETGQAEDAGNDATTETN